MEDAHASSSHHLLAHIERALQLQSAQLLGSSASLAAGVSHSNSVSSSSPEEGDRKGAAAERRRRGRGRRVAASRGSRDVEEGDRVVLWSSEMGTLSGEQPAGGMRERILAGEFVTVREMFPDGRDHRGRIIEVRDSFLDMTLSSAQQRLRESERQMADISAAMAGVANPAQMRGSLLYAQQRNGYNERLMMSLREERQQLRIVVDLLSHGLALWKEYRHARQSYFAAEAAAKSLGEVGDGFPVQREGSMEQVRFEEEYRRFLDRRKAQEKRGEPPSAAAEHAMVMRYLQQQQQQQQQNGHLGGGSAQLRGSSVFFELVDATGREDSPQDLFQRVLAEVQRWKERVCASIPVSEPLRAPPSIDTSEEALQDAATLQNSPSVLIDAPPTPPSSATSSLRPLPSLGLPPLAPGAARRPHGSNAPTSPVPSVDLSSEEILHRGEANTPHTPNWITQNLSSFRSDSHHEQDEVLIDEMRLSDEEDVPSLGSCDSCEYSSDFSSASSSPTSSPPQEQRSPRAKRSRSVFAEQLRNSRHDMVHWFWSPSPSDSPGAVTSPSGGAGAASSLPSGNLDSDFPAALVPELLQEDPEGNPFDSPTHHGGSPSGGSSSGGGGGGGAGREGRGRWNRQSSRDLVPSFSMERSELECDGVLFEYEYVPERVEGVEDAPVVSPSPRRPTDRSVLHVEVGDLLGKGAYSSVFLGRIVETGALIAVKRFPMKHMDTTTKRLLESESQVWKTLSHPNVVRYLGYRYASRQRECSIILEYVDGCSLAELLARLGRIPEGEVATLVKQILLGLQYLHQRHVIHRDLKPANMLLSRSGVVKICDFGVSVQVSDRGSARKSCVGTANYCAPEVIEMRPYSFGVDIWSLGCSVAELLSGVKPFGDMNEYNALNQMVENEHPPLPASLSDSCSPESVDFILKCWTRVPEERPTVEDLLVHPFVTRASPDLSVLVATGDEHGGTK